MRVILHAFVHFQGVFELEYNRTSAHVVQEVVVEEYDTLQSTIWTYGRCYKPVVLRAFQIKSDNVRLIFIFETEIKVLGDQEIGPRIVLCDAVTRDDDFIRSNYLCQATSGVVEEDL